MWVFDGEKWTQEDAGEQSRKPETAAVPFDALVPELQVVEIVKVPKGSLPPFPLP